MIAVGDLRAVKGGLVKGFFHVGGFADGSRLALPVMIASGAKDGPTVWIDAGVHGEEYGGTVTIIHFIGSLDLKALAGTIVAFPAVNLLGFRELTRNTPLDGMNLNRVFPGKPGGSFSEQVAYDYFQALCSTADYLIDLHSGGVTSEVPFYAIYHDDRSQTAAHSREMCCNCGSPLIWRVSGEAGLNGSITAQAVHHGIPAVTIECGGGEVTEADLEKYLLAINGILRGLGILPGQPPRQARYTLLSGGEFMYNRRGGIFVADCKVGDVLKKGQSIGRFFDLFGETVDQLEAPADNVCITALGLPNHPFAAGDLIAEAVPVVVEE